MAIILDSKRRKTILRVLSKCILCKKYIDRSVETLPSTLPEDRIRDASVFEVTGQDNLKRSDWLIGRVIDIYPGKDNKVREVKMKTKAGELIRSVKKLYPVELSSFT
ncbi:hypothetical protein NPIL_165921 [Nephila pilipes]|uniref:DUF5641 domain-containing protein n=1 Tax=Nephila pilipes TaxID=299642 RepID=A0A8X6UQG4_NEPPI|nr:hypothetical protein NPIL_165921 [Nephila pilipes]